MPSPKRGKQRKQQDDAPFEDFDERRSDINSSKGCKNKSQPELVKGPWSKAEDELLIKLVEEYGAKDWSKIAAAMAKRGQPRMGKQCRERWFNHLSPDVRKEAWTPEEDRIIINAHRQLGNKWTAISRLLQGRPANAIKNHWNSTLKRQIHHEDIPSKNPKRQRLTESTPTPRKRRRLSFDTDEDLYDDDQLWDPEDEDDENGTYRTNHSDIEMEETSNTTEDERLAKRRSSLPELTIKIPRVLVDSSILQEETDDDRSIDSARTSERTESDSDRSISQNSGPFTPSFTSSVSNTPSTSPIPQNYPMPLYNGVNPHINININIDERTLNNNDNENQNGNPIESESYNDNTIAFNKINKTLHHRLSTDRLLIASAPTPLPIAFDNFSSVNSFSFLPNQSTKPLGPAQPMTVTASCPYNANFASVYPPPVVLPPIPILPLDNNVPPFENEFEPCHFFYFDEVVLCNPINI